VRSWQESYRGLLPDSYLDALSEEQHVEYWRAYLEDMPEADRLWVEEEDARVVGYVRTGPDAVDGRDGQIFGVAAETESHALLAQAIEDLRGREFRDATVAVLAGDHAGAALYESLGFAPDGSESEVELDGTVALERRFRRGLNDLDF
jgi:predicted GNAT family N-acyltransferase